MLHKQLSSTMRKFLYLVLTLNSTEIQAADNGNPEFLPNEQICQPLPNDMFRAIITDASPNEKKVVEVKKEVPPVVRSNPGPQELTGTPADIFTNILNNLQGLTPEQEMTKLVL